MINPRVALGIIVSFFAVLFFANRVLKKKKKKKDMFPPIKSTPEMPPVKRPLFSGDPNLWSEKDIKEYIDIKCKKFAREQLKKVMKLFKNK